MSRSHDYVWPHNRKGAVEIQSKARELVQFSSNTAEPSIVAAVDTAYGVDAQVLYSCAVAMSWPDLELIEQTRSEHKVNLPHIPGLLFFREGPALVQALSQLKCEPDLIIVDGHGQAHPDGCGMAGHIGLIFDRPTIGCARRLMTGRYLPLDEKKGASQPIMHEGKSVGLACRTKDRVKPVFISPGHRCNINFARQMIISMLRGFRQPEPLRLAHLNANKHKRRMEKARKQTQPTN